MSSSLRTKRGRRSTFSIVSCTRSSASSREPQSAHAARNSRSRWSPSESGSRTGATASHDSTRHVWQEAGEPGVLDGDGSSQSKGTLVKRPTLVAALGTTLVAGFAATALPAQAAPVSASIVDTTATLNLDGADDNVTVTVQNGVFVHGLAGGG